MNPNEIREMAMAFQKSRILLTAVELDLFTLLGLDHIPAGQVAQHLGTDVAATTRLLNAIAALHLIGKKDNRFHNTPESFMYLSKNGASYQGGLMHSNHLWDTWSNLTEVVKAGRASHLSEINNRGEGWLNAFIHAMHDRGKKQAPEQVAKINLNKVERLLDLGGGSGCYTMEFLRQKPQIKAGIFDLPNVIPITKRLITGEGFSDQIELFSGDYTTDMLPGGYDLIFLSAIIHSNSYETNQKLISKCFESLNANGRVVIQDWIMNENKTEPLQGAVFSINMLVGVEEGDCYSETEVNTWLTNAGFSEVYKVNLEAGLAQMTGIKKG